MRYDEFRKRIDWPVFTQNQAGIPLHRWVKAGKLIRLKRELYLFADREVDEFTIGCLAYQPSYVSLESALNIYGIIPDVPMSTTLVTQTTTRKHTMLGRRYSYSKIALPLYWGFTAKADSNDSRLTYQIADPEKALLDWIYIRKVKSLEELRVEMRLLRKTYMARYLVSYPTWVRKVWDDATSISVQGY